MTGKELKARISDSLRWRTSLKADREAFDGCVLLTAEEAKKVRLVFGPLVTEYWSEGQEALALLGGERQ